ncbi:hypothetical protein R3P38DRAFT_3204427 [Favolaschia claudopus]|uniref:Uncharacterized protein n=1 Tax=Favolaschia claudopus TaxID=2862362 RepID=A0AAW0APD8_9AGAR
MSPVTSAHSESLLPGACPPIPHPPSIPPPRPTPLPTNENSRRKLYHLSTDLLPDMRDLIVLEERGAPADTFTFTFIPASVSTTIVRFHVHPAVPSLDEIGRRCIPF